MRAVVCPLKHGYSTSGDALRARQALPGHKKRKLREPGKVITFGLAVYVLRHDRDQAFHVEPGRLV